MKRIFFCILLIAMLLSSCSSAKKIKIACVGDSITYGAGIGDREKESYPGQLEYNLGDSYQVGNFGVNYTTLTRNGNLPYISTDQYRESLEFVPDIVLIKLGTNDTKPYNSSNIETEYKSDYKTLISSYRTLASKPRVILLKPVPCYAKEGEFADLNNIYETQIIPIIEEIAYEEGLEVINLYNIFDKSQWDESLFPDSLHPSSPGASMIASYIFDIISREKCSSKIDKTGYDEEFNFHGYRGYKKGENMIVEPFSTAQGSPWVLRARFWGHEPQTDIALLERGFHIAYCDVADLYGSPAAIERYDLFYTDMVERGACSKVVLEAMSRGGLIAFNWAAKNSDKIAAIYADAPVMDIKSWPLGFGDYVGSVSDSINLMKAYGFENIDQVRSWSGNPLDQIDQLKNIPTIIVVGDADKIVPIYENAAIFEQQVPAVKVIHKEGVGHHPHSLYEPSPIVDFITKSCGI